MVAGCSILDTGYWMLATGYWILFPGLPIAGCRYFFDGEKTLFKFVSF
jgi:hypothetical protein